MAAEAPAVPWAPEAQVRQAAEPEPPARLARAQPAAARAWAPAEARAPADHREPAEHQEAGTSELAELQETVA